MKSLALIALVLFAPLSFAADQVCFYEHINYQGRSFCVSAGHVDADLRQSGWARRISSIIVRGSAAVKLFNNVNLMGASAELNTNISDLRNFRTGWNDIAMSYQTRTVNAGRACFFQHDFYQGGSFCVGAGQTVGNIGVFKPGWNDQVSSIRVDGPVTVKIWEHSDFIGRMLWVRGSVYSLGQYGFNDQVSSFRVVDVNGN